MYARTHARVFNSKSVMDCLSSEFNWNWNRIRIGALESTHLININAMPNDNDSKFELLTCQMRLNVVQRGAPAGNDNILSLPQKSWDHLRALSFILIRFIVVVFILCIASDVK